MSANPKDSAGRAKPPLRYVPPALELAVAEAMEYGAMRYGPFNWRDSGVSLMTYIEAAKRHLMCLQDGEDIDPQSGAHHAAHVAAGMAVVLDALSLGRLDDDRPAPGAAPDLIEEMRLKRVAARSSRRAE